MSPSGSKLLSSKRTGFPSMTYVPLIPARLGALFTAGAVATCTVIVVVCDAVAPLGSVAVKVKVAIPAAAAGKLHFKGSNLSI